jgi:hypothetical protein
VVDTIEIEIALAVDTIEIEIVLAVDTTEIEAVEIEAVEVTIETKVTTEAEKLIENEMYSM